MQLAMISNQTHKEINHGFHSRIAVGITVIQLPEH